MDRFDGTAARQLVLMDEGDGPLLVPSVGRRRPVPTLRLLQKDVYAELNRRRRRAQIAARHELDK
jgi:hypothetical protein